MRNTRKIIVALLVLMTLMVSMFAVTANAAAGQTWTVAGSQALCGSNWSTTDKNNDMTYDAATDSYVKIYTNVKAGTYEFKCAKNHAWTTAYPSSNYNLKVAKDGSTVTITLKGTTVKAVVEAPSCNHVYEVTAQTVTCVAAGTRTWTCSVCSDSYTENLAALGHRYGEDGKCKACDATTAVVKVYVDNAANWANVYCYAWATDPYVAWPGEAMEKGEDGLYFYVVPKSCVNIIFNNGEGTQSADLKTPTTNAVVYNNAGKTWAEKGEEVEIPEVTYIVAGNTALTGFDWNPNQTANIMTLGEDGLYTKVYENVAAGKHEFKVVQDGDWNLCWGDPANTAGGNNYVIEVVGGSKVTITFNPANKEVKCTVEAPETPVADTYTVTGTICPDGQWNLDDDLMTLGEDGIYSITYTDVKKGGYSLKVIKNRTWGAANEFSDGNENYDCFIKYDGSVVTIKFDPATSTITHEVYYNDEQVILYIVAGSSSLLGSNWAHTDVNNEMTKLEDGKYQLVIENAAAGNHELKVVKDGNWDIAACGAPDGNNYNLAVATAGSKVTITYDPAAHAITHTVEAPHVHSYEADVTAPTCTTAGFTTYTCACGDSYTGDEVAATGHVCVLDVCLVCYLPQPSIVLGDNTVVVPESGSAFGMIYIAEAGTYQITANPATTACIFYTNIYSEGADFSIAADGTLGASWYAFSVAPVELQPGYYYIGVYGLGEYTVNLSTYVAPVEPPVANDNVIDFSKLDPYAKGTYADGEEQKFNDIFTFFHGKDSRIDGSEKSFEDGFSGTQRFGFGGKFKTVDGGAGRALQINAPAAGTVTLWWVSGGAGRSVDLLNAAFETISSTGTETVEDGGIYITTFEISEAGVYYLTNMVNNNYWFKVEYKASETPVEPPHENTLAVGDTNKIVVDGSVLNAYGQPIAWVEFVADEKAHYEFVGTDGALAFIYAGDIDINNAPAASLCGYSGKADLEAGTYLICIGGGKTGEFNIAVSKSEIPETPVEPPVEPPVTPEYPALQVGENTVTIDGSVVNLTGNAIAWYEFTVETAGTYAIVSDDLNGYFYSKPDIGDFAACVCGFKGVADLEPGKYYICVGKEGKTGEFSVSIVTGEIEAPASNTVVLGENKYVLNAPLLAIGYEFVTFTAEKAGWYTISGADPITFFIWPDYPNVAVTDIPTTAPYAWNVKHDNSGFEESFTVYLEAGVYAVGFRYDFAEVGEYDYTITYSETDPNPVEPPVVVPELTLFEKIMLAIKNFFAQISAWFENLFAGLKK